MKYLEYGTAVQAAQDCTKVIGLLDLTIAAGNHILQV